MPILITQGLQYDPLAELVGVSVMQIRSLDIDVQ
jgi:hypothetical protein